ncbi:MAG: FkbM family methyltransferase [Cytophagales bacterium]|jgi:FkbM family methyltransferase|nr:FkbM family methyltransferase [Cytophagales bacterium]
MKQRIYDFLYALGLDVKLVRSENTRWLQNRNLRAVLDIGANTGQFAQRIHELLPNAQIFSFEPISECYNELVRNTASIGVKTYPFALGDSNESVAINVSRHSPSSSLLEMADLHHQTFAGTEYDHQETIQVKRLDDVAATLSLPEPFMAKIDVQGFEDRVIRGGGETLRRADLIVIETSFRELYKGQVLFDGIYSQLKELGFVFAGNWTQAKSPADGSILYAESVFVKP